MLIYYTKIDFRLWKVSLAQRYGKAAFEISLRLKCISDMTCHSCSHVPFSMNNGLYGAILIIH